MLTQQIGKALRAERERQGLTQKAVAVKMGRSYSLVQHIENHTRDTRLSTIERYAEALGVQLAVSVSRTE